MKMMINKSPKFSNSLHFSLDPRQFTFDSRHFTLDPRQKRTVVNVVIELFDNSPHDPLRADVQLPLNPIYTGKNIELRSPTPIMDPALIQVKPHNKIKKAKMTPCLRLKTSKNMLHLAAPGALLRTGAAGMAR